MLYRLVLASLLPARARPGKAEACLQASIADAFLKLRACFKLSICTGIGEIITVREKQRQICKQHEFIVLIHNRRVLCSVVIPSVHNGGAPAGCHTGERSTLEFIFYFFALLQQCLKERRGSVVPFSRRCLRVGFWKLTKQSAFHSEVLSEKIPHGDRLSTVGGMTSSLT